MELPVVAVDWAFSLFIAGKQPDLTIGQTTSQLIECDPVRGVCGVVNSKCRPIRFAQFAE